MPVFAVTIFIGAFLLFQVQPLIGKYILPWFGGGPGVWTTCMLFFQVLLLGGYAYAHFTSRWLRPRTQVLVHLLLLGAALALLPITPADSWKPRGDGHPTLQILVLLAASLGLPYFVLSSTGPLLQQWFTRIHPGRSPYRLYALSNAGSLLALLSYPVYFESHFTRKAQTGGWGLGLLAFVICCAWCAARLWRAGSPKSEEFQAALDAKREPGCLLEAPGSEASKFQVQGSPTLDWLLWLLLPACASVLLLATTNKMCQDVAVIPFLWILPLALYLLSFIICFDSPRWYVRLPFTLALIAGSIGICWALFQGTDISIYKQVGLYSAGLFICCMVCHGELYRLRPEPRQLTAFYLMVAAGGALGGLFVALAAPLLFTDYYELHWGLFLSALLFLATCLRENSAGTESSGVAQFEVQGSRTPGFSRPQPPTTHWRLLACILPLIAFGGLDWLLAGFGRHSKLLPGTYVIGLRIGMWSFLAILVVSWMGRRKFATFKYWRFLACLWLALGCVALGLTLWTHANKSAKGAVYRARNFYGVLTVYERRKQEPKAHHLVLQHGRITHGLQFLDPQQKGWPTTYYGKESGVGLALTALPTGSKRIGVVGLGTGTLAAYGRPGDYVRIYEINPQVKALAESRFTYLSECPARVELALGDARLSMERESPQRFDLLALDAFSSDSIPVHLLTREAFELYQRHLKPNGIIAVHISNHFLDLEPVMLNIAREFNFKLTLIDYDETDAEWWLYSSTWMLLTRSEQLIHSPEVCEAASLVQTNAVKVPLWTDDFASLFQILR